MNFDFKTFRNKHRLFVPLKKPRGVSQVYVWSDEKLVYEAPPFGSSYSARKTVRIAGRKGRRVQRLFDSLAEAQAWLYDASRGHESEADHKEKFSSLVRRWKESSFPRNRPSTNDRYEDMLRLYFSGLMDLSLGKFTPRLVDDWIAELRAQPCTRKRISFRHELELLGTILRFYEEYDDSNSFRCPIKRRHRLDVRGSNHQRFKPKDFELAEFNRFTKALLNMKGGQVFADLATVQYFHALRVSEAAALHFEDVSLDLGSPERSSLRISKYVRYRRRQGIEPEVVTGFKNSVTNGGIKGSCLHPETFEVFSRLKTPWSRGLIFSEDGKPLRYRSIQHKFNCAFRKAELPYTATHIMRHGGTRHLFNMCGDMSVAKQLLGNSDTKTAEVYARRDPRALNAVIAERWKVSGTSTLVTNGDSVNSESKEAL